MAGFLLDMMDSRHLDGKRIRNNFSDHAGEYDQFAVVQRRVVDRLSGALQKEGSLQGNFLDVGTGTGMLACRLMEVFPRLNPAVCDLAHGMTRMALSRLKEAGGVDADAHALPFRDASMNLVVSSSVYQWVEDLPAAFGESARVLCEEGVFAFALFGEGTLRELRSSHLQAVKEIKGKAFSHFQVFPSESQVRKALFSAGFQEAEIWSEDEREHHAGVVHLLRGLKKIGASNASSDRPSGLASRRIMQRMVEIYELMYGGEEGLIPATYQVIYGVARKKNRRMGAVSRVKPWRHP